MTAHPSKVNGFHQIFTLRGVVFNTEPVKNLEELFPQLGSTL
jgi:hypothetical protein